MQFFAGLIGGGSQVEYPSSSHFSCDDLKDDLSVTELASQIASLEGIGMPSMDDAVEPCRRHRSGNMRKQHGVPLGCHVGQVHRCSWIVQVATYQRCENGGTCLSGLTGRSVR
jgi:hypothetical protein